MDAKLICEVIGLTHDELNIIKKELNKRAETLLFFSLLV